MTRVTVWQGSTQFNTALFAKRENAEEVADVMTKVLPAEDGWRIDVKEEDE